VLLSVSLWTIGRPPSEDSLDVRGRIRTPTRTCEVLVVLVVAVVMAGYQLLLLYWRCYYRLLPYLPLLWCLLLSKITANFLPTTETSGLLSE